MRKTLNPVYRRQIACLLVSALSVILPVDAGHAQQQNPPLPAKLLPAKPLPAGGAKLLTGDDEAALRLQSPPNAARLESVRLIGQPFDRALRLATQRRVEGEDTIALVADLPNRIDNGDTIFVRFWARTTQTADETGAGRFRLNIQAITPQAESTAFFPPLQAAPGEEWELYEFPRTSRRAFQAGDARLVLGFGKTEPQTIEIAGFQILNFGPTVLPSQLPFRLETYEGRDAGAPWRKEAEARIEKHRKADFSIQVRDAAGRAVPGAAIEIKMLRHAYGFGSEYNPRYLTEDTPAAQKYREWMPKLFNRAVPGNGLKWQGWENLKQRPATLESIRWLRERGLTVRGHTFVWPSWRRAPAALKTFYDETLAAQGEAAAKIALQNRILDHIREEGSALRGQIFDWDVVNEPSPNNDILRILGPSAMAEWFKVAREATGPDVRLCLNHNAILSGGNMENVLRYVTLLREQGAPISGVNEEGHTRPMSIPQLLKNVDKLGALGLPIQITEFDVVTPDEQLQADWTRDYMTVMFSHPATDGFVMWGFWDGAHWLNDAPIFYKDWTLKPSGQAYLDLVTKAWWTNARGQANPQGQFGTRGFLGDYEVIVKTQGKTKVVKATLTKTGGPLVVKLD